MVAGVHDVVRTANQLGRSVATDLGEGGIDVRDDAANIRLRDDGVQVDGAHQRCRLSQRSLQTELRSFALGDVCLDRHEPRQRAGIVVHGNQLDIQPILAAVFADIDQLDPRTTASLLGLKQLLDNVAGRGRTAQHV